MDDDKKFQQRWEFRRKEIDGDTSSDDNRSNASGPRPANSVTDLVLLESKAAGDNPETQTRDKENLKAGEKKKTKSIKKRTNDAVQIIKKNTRKRNSKKNEETVMLNDLKGFANSLIQELTSARENMFAHMRDEMSKLAAEKKNRVRPQKGITKPRNVKCDVGPDVVKTTRDDVGLRVLATTARMNLANASDQVVSSSYLTLPTVIPKTQFQSPINHLPFLNNERGTGKLIDGARFHNRGAEFCPEERFGSFSQTANSVAFPIPLSRGTDNVSGLSYCESLFVGSNKVGPRMNGVMRFPRGNLAPSDQMLAYSNMARKSDGEFVPVSPQEFKDAQLYMNSLRNQQ